MYYIHFMGARTNRNMHAEHNNVNNAFTVEPIQTQLLIKIIIILSLLLLCVATDRYTCVHTNDNIIII